MNITPSDEPRWYIAHTYSGYENKVKHGIESMTEHRGMQDQILEVKVPVQEVVETKNGKTVVKEKKLFPGYVLINMKLNNETWYVVRNTRGVTGFVGPGSDPVPMTDEELIKMGIMEQPVPVYQTDYQVGDSVRIIEGPFQDFVGVIKEAYPEKSRVKVNISMFGHQETPTELEFRQIRKNEE